MLPLLALACACTGNQTGSQSQVDTVQVDSTPGLMLDTVRYQLSKKLIEGKEAPSYTITYTLLAAKGSDQVSCLFNEELARELFGKDGIQVDSAMHLQADSLASACTSDLNQFYDPAYEDSFTFKYQFETRADVHADSYPGVAAYSTDEFSYTGGAHGNREVRAVNLNKLTGRAIRRADFFQDGKLAEVKGLVEQSLMKSNGCTTMSQLVERTGICSLGQVYVGEHNFLLLRDSVEFIYNPYEVASWANGLITTRVAYSDLAPCIRQDVLPKQ